MSGSPVLIEGPWQHRSVHAHGARFHVALAGQGPLVVLVHGFPTFWWLWRHVMPAIASAGFTVAAMDMRGYGATDHPPRGYDPRTLAADVVGVTHALGFASSVVVGHGIGGMVAWTAGTVQTSSIRALATVGSAHPNALRAALLTDAAQVRAQSYVAGLQPPFLAERMVARDGAQWVADLLTGWTGPARLDDDTLTTYRHAFLNGNTAHCSIEFHRWAVRSLPRSDGRAYSRDMANGVTIPVLQVHGRSDTAVLPTTAEGSAAYAHGDFESHLLDCGHLVPEQAPLELGEILTRWLHRLP